MAGAVLRRLLGGGGSDSNSWQAACAVNRLRGEKARPLQVTSGRAARNPPGGGAREAEVTGNPMPPLLLLHHAVLPPPFFAFL